MSAEKKIMRALIGLTLCICILCGTLSGAYALSNDTESLINELVSAETSGVSVQEFANGDLVKSADNGNEWFAFALSRLYSELDMTKYATALASHADGKDNIGAVALQRYALTLIACGRESSYTVTRALEESIGEQGIMSFVFGLILLSNNLPSGKTDASSCIDAILSEEIAGGGWSLNGSVPDPDVTAMVISALAAFSEISTVADAIERGVSVLSTLQNADGDFSSYGAPNPESTAQVVIALCSLGIDPLSDGRFIKNGNTLLDGMVKYRISSGAYSHTYGGTESDNADVQVLLALTAMKRLGDGDTGIYVFGELDYTETQKPLNGDEELTVPWYKTYRLYLLVGAVAAAAVITVFLALKKRRASDILLVWAVAGVIVAAGFWLNIQSTEQYYGEKEELGTPVGSVNISIKCDQIEDVEEILTETDVMLYDGDTVLDVLTRVCKSQKITLEVTGGYVNGIGGLYEFDHGQMSGWVYSVNGEVSNYGCDKYILRDGDAVVFSYSVSR